MREQIIDAVTKYHIQNRQKKFGKQIVISKYSVSLHNAFHNLLLTPIRWLRLARGHGLTIIKDERLRKDENAIYACTHIGGHDVETLFEAIKTPCFLFIGDPREVYINLDGFMLWLNGAICFETGDKGDRRIAKQRACELLKVGGSLMIFPEGAWNIYSNLPVMPLYWGAAQMAIETGVGIVPVAIEKYGDTYYVNIGKNIEVSGTQNLDKESLTDNLSDILATLKWEIWEKQGLYERRKLTEDEEEFVQNIFGEKNTSFTIEDALRTRRYYEKVGDDLSNS